MSGRSLRALKHRSFASRAYRALAQDEQPPGAFEKMKRKASLLSSCGASELVILSAEGAKDPLPKETIGRAQTNLGRPAS